MAIITEYVRKMLDSLGCNEGQSMAKALLGTMKNQRELMVHDIEIARIRAQRDRLAEFVKGIALSDEHVALLVAPNVGRARSMHERIQDIADVGGFVTGQLVLAGVEPDGQLSAFRADAPVALAAEEPVRV